MTNNIQNYLHSTAVNQKLADLAKYYGLDDKQNRAFIAIVNLFSKGEIAEDQIALRLEEDLDIDFNTAMSLMMDIRRKVLAPVIKQIESLLSAVPPAERERYMPDKLVEQGLKEAGFKPRDKNIQNRIEKAVLSWFKDVRDDAELKETLTKSEKIGGVDMPAEVFDKLLAFLKTKMADIKSNNIDIVKIIEDYEKMVSGDVSDVSVLPEEVAEEAFDVAAVPPKAEKEAEKITGEEITIDKLLETHGIEEEKLEKKEELVKKLAAEKESPLVQEITKKEEFLESKEEVAPPPPVVKPQTDVFTDFTWQEGKIETKEEEIPDFDKFVWQEQVMAEPEPEKKTLTAPSGPPQKQDIPKPKFSPQEAKQPLIKKAAGGQGQRPVVEDVKFSAKLYGPIEELASLSIADFRRLSKDPLEAADKIIGKLDLLESESIVQKTAGISALKSSPLYKLYADIMNSAIKDGKSIEEIIKERFEDKITMDEYKAITELNKSIKY